MSKLGIKVDYCLSDDALWAKISSTLIHNFRHLNNSLLEENFVHSKIYFTNIFLVRALNTIS